jgi:hypothetical protein
MPHVLDRETQDKLLHQALKKCILYLMLLLWCQCFHIALPCMKKANVMQQATPKLKKANVMQQATPTAVQKKKHKIGHMHKTGGCIIPWGLGWPGGDKEGHAVLSLSYSTLLHMS